MDCYKKNLLIVEQPPRQIPCSADVLLWNYWDDEHLIPVHAGYESAKVLYMGKNFQLIWFKTKAHIIPFTIPTLAFAIQHSTYQQFTYAMQFFLVSKTEISIEPKSSESCILSVKYKFLVPRFIPFAKSILRSLIPKWFERAYEEDLQLRMRRQRVLSAGFKDYKGMPSHFNESNPGKSYKFKQPLLPAPGSPLLDHPFYDKSY